WSTGFMPATFQGTRFREGKTPVLHLKSEESSTRQRAKLDFMQELNRRHQKDRAGDGELEARIASYELAFKMQKHAPEAVDLAKESAETRKLYGLDRKETDRLGRCCLLARRL